MQDPRIDTLPGGEGGKASIDRAVAEVSQAGRRNFVNEALGIVDVAIPVYAVDIG